jgi:drug/metabolite transporter (DMT)-like permease
LEKQKRPTGVTVIAILIIIGGILLLLAGVGGVAVGSLLIPEITGLVFVIIGAILLAIGIGYLIVSYGLLKGKGWAWTITVVLLFIGIVINVASIVFGSFVINMDIATFLTANIGSIAGIIISVIILYYLYRPHVKSYFGKLHPTTTAR